MWNRKFRSGNRKKRALPTAIGKLARIGLALFFASAGAAIAQAPVGDTTTQTSSTESSSPSTESAQLEISLLTVGPGPIFWERFGHNAIVVRDAQAGTAIAYNYGIFDFEQGDFLLNFARGNMRYRIAADDVDDDIAMYREESRSIKEQRLAFTQEQARVLHDFLLWNTQPENAFYRYDYYLANCSTRVRDALDQALGGLIKRDTEGRSRGYTYRMDSLRLMAPEPLLMLGIDLGLGPYADQRIDFWDEGFVPALLARALEEANTTSADGTKKPLIDAEREIERGAVAEPPDLPPDLRLPFMILGAALALAVFALARSRSRAVRAPVAIFAIVFELFCGVGGLVLLFLWFATAHQSAWRNENLFLLNPLCLLLIPTAATWLRARPRASRWRTRIAWLVAALAAFALFSKILPWFVQANLHWIVLFLPIHVAIALVATRRHPVLSSALR